MKALLTLIAIMTFSNFAVAAPTVDLCGEQVEYRLIETMNATLSEHLYGLSSLDGIQKTTVCTKGADQYVIFNYKGNTFFHKMNPLYR